jgi:hypothetical protein
MDLYLAKIVLCDSMNSLDWPYLPFADIYKTQKATLWRLRHELADGDFLAACVGQLTG